MILNLVLYLLFVCVDSQSQKDDTQILISGPGLNPQKIVMPARYFFVNFTSINADS